MLGCFQFRNCSRSPFSGLRCIGTLSGEFHSTHLYLALSTTGESHSRSKPKFFSDFHLPCCLSHPTGGKVLPVSPTSASRSQQATDPRTLHLAALLLISALQRCLSQWSVTVYLLLLHVFSNISNIQYDKNQGVY